MKPAYTQSTLYTHIEIGSLHLAVPQSDIQSVELCHTITHSDSCSPVAGYIETQQMIWPVIALDEDLQIQADISERYRFIVCFKSHRNKLRFAIPCNKVSKLSLSEQEIPIPPAIKNKNIALLCAHEFEDTLCFVTHAERLLTHFSEEHDLTFIMDEMLADYLKEPSAW